MKKYISEDIFFKIYILLIFSLAYIFPTKLFQDFLGIAIDSYLYGGLTLIMLFVVLISKSQCFPIRYLLFFVIVVFIVIFQKRITALHLLGLILIDYVSCKKEDYAIEINFSKIYCFCGCMGLILYSILYFGKMNRFVYLGVGEVNISGLGIFLLASILRKEHKRLSIFIWGIGILTLSRNYLLALLVYVIFSILMSEKCKWIYDKSIRWFSFGKIGVISTILLIGVSNLFQKIYLLGGIKEYTDKGLGRFVNLFDISNYHRFIVNDNVFEIYKKNPYLLLSGIDNNEFSEYNLIICKELGRDFSYDRPHNFFFSYIQIYGIFAIIIFAFMAHFFSLLINKNNFPIFMAVMCYGLFLGMGLSGYWLWIFVISLILNQ